MAVRADEQIDQAIASRYAAIQSDLFWFVVEVMQRQHAIVAPVITNGQDIWSARVQYLERTPADFGALLAQSDHAFRPVQHGIRVALLCSDVDSPIAPDSIINDGQNCFRRG